MKSKSRWLAEGRIESSHAYSRWLENGKRHTLVRWWIALESQRYWFLAGLFLFAYGLYTNITSGLITNDESWFLQVAHRMTTGDVLYRDVFFGATPFSVYLTAALVALFGTEIVVVKAVMALSFALTGLLSYRIAQQLQLGKTLSILLVVTLLAYVPSWVPGAGSLYTPLANLFLLGCFSAFLTWREGEILGTPVAECKAKVALAIAAVSAGLCFATKQNLGLYAIAALWLAYAVSYRDIRMSPRRLLEALLLVSAVFLLSAGFILLPVWFSGGIEQFLDYGFLNKGTYLQFAQIPYSAQLEVLWRQATHPRSLGDLRDLYWQTQLLLPPLTYVALLIAWLRGASKRGLLFVILIFTLTAFADVFPRVSIHHTAAAMPAHLLALGWAWRQMQINPSARWLLVSCAVIILWLGTGVIYLVMNPVRWMTSGAFTFSSLPHVRGALLPVTFLESMRTQSESLKAADDGSLFIASPSAGLYYLVTEIKNPTPFDYPLVTAFGKDGQAQVIAAIQQQQIRSVCLTRLGSYYLKPSLIEDFVQEHMEPGRDFGFCTLYHTLP